MIEKLHQYSSCKTNKYGEATHWIYHPTDDDLMEKINELIDKINELEGRIDESQISK